MEKHMNTWNKIKSDIFRIHGKFSVKLLLIAIVSQRTFRPILTLRLCQGAMISRYPIRATLPLLQVAHRIATHMAGMDFSWRTKIGQGFAITHGWGVVINQESIIGNDVTIFHGATLGRRDRISIDGERSTEYPTLEDEVWVGPHAIIVGGVTIGKGSRIGGGAFVTEDIPPYSVVTGNPSTIVKRNCQPDVVHRSKTCAAS